MHKSTKIGIGGFILALLIGLLVMTGLNQSAQAQTSSSASQQQAKFCSSGNRCRVVDHVADDGFDGAFYVKCEKANGDVVVRTVEEYQGTNGDPNPCPDFSNSTNPGLGGVMAFKSAGPGYIVRCSTWDNPNWFNYGHSDGTWQYLADPPGPGNQHFDCVSQVA